MANVSNTSRPELASETQVAELRRRASELYTAEREALRERAIFTIHEYVREFGGTRVQCWVRNAAFVIDREVL